MGSMRKITGRHRRAAWRWPALALDRVLAAAGCNGQGASKAGGAPEAAPDGTITLSFASADQLPVDTTFATLVAKDSGGHLKLHTSYYNGRSTSIDVQSRRRPARRGSWMSATSPPGPGRARGSRRSAPTRSRSW